MTNIFKRLSVLFAFAIIACQPNAPKEEAAEGETIGNQIVVTTSLLRDMLENILPEGEYKIESLMGSGVDPHLYKPTRKDVQRLRNADVVLFNGVHLEGRMDEIKTQLAKTQVVLTASNGFDKNRLINNTDFEDGQDPHFWFDLSMWIDAGRYMADTLSTLYPEHKDVIQSNVDEWSISMKRLHIDAANALEVIPENRREIITSHDALSYFARSFNFRVRSLQGSSTSAEFGIKDVKDLVEYIIEREIPAIFPENITSDQALQAIYKGCEKRGYELVIADELYSDALGEKGSNAGTFAGMYLENVRTIVEALK